MTGPTAARRNDYYRRLDPHAMAPLWEVLGNLVTPSPASRCRPACWRYADIRSLLLEIGRPHLRTGGGAAGAGARESGTQRRVEDHDLHSTPASSSSCRREIAPAHRHTQTALRFVVEGEGAYTAVDGEKAVMREGDFIITPSGTWHDHGNESDRPVMWLDGLDIPIVSLFDASFAERHPEEAQIHSRPSGDTVARYGSGLLPLESPSGRASPIFSFPYARTRDALDRLRANGTVDACHGIRMKYANPVDGGYALPTIATFIQLLPRGFAGALHRSTDATVFCVAEGEGRTVAGEETFTWGPRDTFVVPSWCPRRHEVEEEAVLFSFSDRAVQESLGLWREEREPFGGPWT